MKKVTMKDIADRVGVSKMTVSKFFNGNGDISEEMKGKIAAVAEELGYKYNTGKTLSIVVLVPEIFLKSDENFYTRIYKNLNTEASLKGVVITLLVVKKDEEKSCQISSTISNGFDGIIVLGQLMVGYIKKLKTLDIPTILVDFQYRNVSFDSVVNNNFLSSYEITSHLIDNNHVKIAFLGNNRETVSIQDRFLGYYRALLEVNLEYNDKLVFKEEDEIVEIFNTTSRSELPTAVVCNNDHIAYELVEKLKKAGLSIPKDVSVVGFDDVIYSQISEPKLTTVAVKRRKMAKEAIELLIRRVKHSKAEKITRVVEGEIIYRDSVVDPKTGE